MDVSDSFPMDRSIATLMLFTSGNGTFMLHNILSGGDVVQFSVTGYDKDAVDSDRWQKTMSSEQIRDFFIDPREPSHLDKAITEVTIMS